MEDNKENQIKEELKKYEHFDQDTIVEKYNELAEKYDQTLLDVVGYPDPSKICEALKQVGIAKDAPILDFGCGTGLVGKNCKDEGFTNIVGIDASPEMLEKAKDRGYSELKEVFLGANKFPSELEGKFEVAVSAGVLADGHVSPEIFDEKLKCLKPIENESDKRYIIFSTMEKYIKNLGYGEKIKQLETDGKIEFEDKITFTRYHNITDKETDHTVRFKPAEAFCYIYRVKSVSN